MLYLIAQLGGPLVGQRGGGPLHIVGESHQQLPRLALQKQLGMTHLLRVVRGADQTHTGPGTALDLILQTGSGAVAKVAVLTLAHAEHFLQKMQGLAHRAGAGIGPEVAALAPLAAAVQGQTRILILAR